MSRCSAGCRLFLRSLCWPASLVGPGQARRLRDAARAGWGSLPRTAPSSCPSATACVAPRLCASSYGYVPFGPSVHPSMGGGGGGQGRSFCKQRFQERREQEQPWCKAWLVWGGWEALGLAVGTGKHWQPEDGLGMVSLVPRSGDLFGVTSELNCLPPDALQSSRRGF